MLVYIDTSVVGGRFDAEFAHLSAPFWNAVFSGEITIIVSSLLDDELKNSPSAVREFFNNIPVSSMRRITLTTEMDDLAERYILENVVGKASRSDCLHIAAATICGADVLVSWNFKHIVNITRIQGYNSVNTRLGYPIIDIRTPSEVKYE